MLPVTEETVSEQMAWGGYCRFCSWFQQHVLQTERVNKLLLKAPFFVKWSVPSKRCLVETNVQQTVPCLIIEFQDCKLSFEAKQSNISGAGTGLFVSCIEGAGLTLKPGEMLDLGVYAPLNKLDVKSRHIVLLKNLLYEWQIETWTFSAHKNDLELSVYDTTDDFSGVCHEAAKRNAISYVNEIDGKGEVANVSAQYDPEGNVHYLLGHWVKNEGNFIIPSGGESFELLVS
jgi:hypothetical protein